MNELGPERDLFDVLDIEPSPFEDEFDDDAYFDEPGRAQQLKVLDHLTQYTNLILYVQGPLGTGKTVLLDRFIAQAGRDRRVVRITATEFLTPLQLLGEMSRGFGLPRQDRDEASLFEALHDHLEGLKRSGLSAVLAVDDAECLNDECLGLVLHMSTAEERQAVVLHSVLFGEELSEAQQARVGELAGNDTLKVIAILPFDEGQTAEYIRHRLRVAATPDMDTFDAKTIRRIYQASQGVPGDINALAREILADREDPEAGEELPPPYLPPPAARRPPVKAIALVLLAVTLVAALFMAHREYEPTAPAKQTTRDLAIPPLDTTGPTPPRIGGHIQRAQESPEPERAFAPVDEDVTMTAIPDAPPATADTPHEPMPARAMAAEPPPSPAVEPRAAAIPSPPAVAVVPAVTTPAAKASTIRREVWLKGRNPNHYTLQLVAAGHEQAVVDFAAKHHVAKDVAYFRSSRQDKAWYSLVYGDYPDRAAAATAAAALPASLRGVNPWIRSFAGIQQDIRKNAR